MAHDLSNIDLEVVGHDEEGNVAVILTPGMVVSLMGLIGHTTPERLQEEIEKFPPEEYPNYNEFVESQEVGKELSKIFYAFADYCKTSKTLEELYNLVIT